MSLPNSLSGLSFEFTLDRNWRITSISESGAAWAGRPAADIVGLDPRKAWSGVPKDAADAIEAAFAGRGSATIQGRSLTIPGLWSRFDIEPSPDGARVRYEDITARVTSEQPLEAADDVPEFGPGLGPAEIAVLDRQGIIIGANSAWRAAFATKIAGVGVGMRYLDVVQAAVSGLDQAFAPQQIDALLSGRFARAEAIHQLDTVRGPELRHALVAPLREGGEVAFVAIHEDLAGRARVLAARDERSAPQGVEPDPDAIALAQHNAVMSQRLDAMVQSLDSLRLRLRADPDAQSILEEMAMLTRQAVQETRVATYLMNAPGHEPVGLVTALRRFVGEFASRTGLEVNFKVTGPVGAVSADVHHAVFRVVQEALANIYRHADAKKVTVSFARLPRVLAIHIADDGKGLERVAAEKGPSPLSAGIAGMLVRIEQLGGTLLVQGGAGGVIVHGTLPCIPTGQISGG
jgi:PAS domain-containing protein